MSTDTDERPGEGLDDALRARLRRLGRTATAGSLPWPAVDLAIRRRRRTTAVGLAALATAAVALAGSVATWGFTDSVAPAPGGVEQPVALTEQPPWPVPSSPYFEVYENVAVDYPLAPEACDTTHSVDLHDPATLVKGPYNTADTRPVALSITCERGQEMGSNLTWNIPTAVPQGPATTAEDCAAAFRNSPETTGSQAPGGVVCLLAPPDPSRGRPLMIVRLEYTQDSTMLMHLSYKLSAWSGGPPTMDGGLPQLNPPTQTESAPSISPEPPVVTVSAPYRAAYENVPLHLPGKPEACDNDEGSFLHLHVPEVSQDLAPSDAMQSPPCPDGEAELQLGTARGAVIVDDDVTPQECAAALAADTPKVWKFTPVVGSTLCMVAESYEGDQPPAKLVALTVTEVAPGTGGFDLSASAWTGKVSKS